MKNYITLLILLLSCNYISDQGTATAVNDTICINQGDPIIYNVRDNDIENIIFEFLYTNQFDFVTDITSISFPEENCFIIDQQGNITYNANGTDDCCGDHILSYESTYLLSNGDGQVEPYTVSAQVYITVKCKPDCALINIEDPSVNTDCIGVCENLSTTIYVPYNSNNSYNWSVIGGTFTTGVNPAEIIVTWGANGFGNVSVSIMDPSNNIQTINKCIDILLSPTASFTYNSITAINTSTIFTNTSINADEYLWTFGDGASSTLQSPSHAYFIPGSYPVTLVANRFNYDVAGNQLCCCSDTLVQYITVDETPCPEIYWVSTLCEGDSSKYWTDATNCSNYNWSVKDSNGNNIPFLQQGNDTICVVWNNGDFGTICLDVAGCDSTFCNLSSCVTVPIISSNSSIIGATNVCEGATEVYTLPKWINADYTWTVLDQNNTPVPFLHQGTHQISVTWGASGVGTIHVDYSSEFLSNLPNHNGNDCSGVADLTVNVRPSFSVTGATLACLNDVTAAAATSLPTGNYTWSITPSTPFTGQGTDNISITWSAGIGTYVVKAVSNSTNSYCNSEASFVVQVKDILPPDPIQGETDICPNETYLYQVAQNTPGVGYNWTVTNGSPSSGTGSSISVVWNGSGTISVTQYMLNQPGCSSNLASININEKVINGPLSITGNVQCVNSLANYSLSTLQHSDAIITWTITPSVKGSVVAGQGTDNIQVQWNNDTGPVTLEAQVELCGVNQSVTLSQTLNSPIIPMITQSTPLCENSGATTLTTTQSFVSYLWNTNAVSNNINITSAGDYNVTTTDINGCEAKGYYQLSTVSLDDNISLSGSQSICIPSNTNRVLSATFNPNYTYQWFCNGTPQPIQSPVNEFVHISTSTPGNFQYYVHIIDNLSGCDANSNTISLTQSTCSGEPCITESNTVFISTNGNIAICDTYTFTPQLTNATFVSWDFGDGTFSSTPTSTHTFTQIGIYTITLTASVPELGNPGSFCLVTSTTQVEIKLVSDFSVNVNCHNAQFTDLSTSTGLINSWNWSFGSITQNPLFTFPWNWSNPSGVSLTVTDDNGCTSTVAKYFNLYGTHIVSTSTNPNSGPYCVDDPINFSAVANNADTYTWSFGDGATYVGLSPSHSYTMAGTYNISLTVSNQQGCTDTETFTIIVNPAIPQLSISPGSQIVCDGTSATFTAPLGYNYLWSNGATTQSITVNTTGAFSVVITDSNGCSTELESVSLDFFPRPDATISGDLIICDQGCTDLSAPLGQGYMYDWFGSGISLSNSSTLNVCTTSGLNNPYHVVVTDNNGCTTQSVPVIISTMPSPLFSINITPTACEGQPINLDVSPIDPNLTYQWTHGPTGPSIIESTSGTYTIIGTDQTTGCSTSANGVINPLPDLCSLPQGCYTTCDPDTICAPIGHTNYQWYHDGNAIPSIPGMNNCVPVIQSGIYTVDVTNSFNCTATSGDIILDVIPCDNTICEGLTMDYTFLLNGNNETDSCCASLDYSNSSGFNLQGLSIHSNDANLNFDLATLDPSLNVFSNTSNSIILTSTTLNAPIPSSISNFIDMCIGEVFNDPQQVIIDWYDFDSEIVCSDTLTFHCPIEPPCLYVKNDSIFCDNGQTFYEVTVCNPHTSTFDVGYIDMIVSSPSGIILTPTSTPTMTAINPPIYPGTCKTFTFDLSGNGINGQTLCYQLTAHDVNPFEVDTALCCTFIEERCVDIPICDPCAYVGIEGVNLNDSTGCCYQFDLYNNYDPNYFDEIALCVLSPTTTITNITNQLGSPWITLNLTGTSVSFFPMLGTVPLGISNLPEICFDTDIAPAQSIEIKWKKNGEVVCRDTTEIYCHPDCGYFVEDTVICDPSVGTWTFNGTLFNNTPYNVTEIVISSQNLAVTGALIPVNIAPYSYSTPLNITIGAPGQAGDNICFTVSMHTITADGFYLECCNFNHCLTLPPCGGDLGCTCNDDFFNHVQNGIDCLQSTTNPMDWSFNLTDWNYFDPECDEVVWYFESGTSSITTSPNSVVNYQFPSVGTGYRVCVVVYRSGQEVGCKESFCKEVIIPFQNIQLTPNPAHSSFGLTVFDKNTKDFNLILTDLSGQTLKQIEVYDYSPLKEIIININDLKPGIYFVKVKSKENEWIEKIIKQ